MTESNRRKHPRVKPKQLITRVRAGEDLHIGLGIENISMGGVFVRSNTPLKIGKVVTLELLRPGATALLAIPGRVTSSVTVAAATEGHLSAGMGIAFSALAPHMEMRLEGLIESIDRARVATSAPPPTPTRKGPVRGRPDDEQTVLAPVFVPPSNDVAVLQRQLKGMQLEAEDRKRKIEELLQENKQLWQRIRTLQS